MNAAPKTFQQKNSKFFPPFRPPDIVKKVQSIFYLSATCCSQANARPGITVNGQIFRILILQDALNGTDCLYPMPGAHSKEIHSYNISRINGKNTKPEMLLPACIMK
ncbi:MAG: hypothetical protein ACTHM7_21425 [Ginsengibacter sp.]